jgi:hypothetical protein
MSVPADRALRASICYRDSADGQRRYEVAFLDRQGVRRRLVVDDASADVAPVELVRDLRELIEDGLSAPRRKPAPRPRSRLASASGWRRHLHLRAAWHGV